MKKEEKRFRYFLQLELLKIFDDTQSICKAVNAAVFRWKNEVGQERELTCGDAQAWEFCFRHAAKRLLNSEK